jgi:hypothetical protein
MKHRSGRQYINGARAAGMKRPWTVRASFKTLRGNPYNHVVIRSYVSRIARIRSIKVSLKLEAVS